MTAFRDSDEGQPKVCGQTTGKGKPCQNAAGRCTAHGPRPVSGETSTKVKPGATQRTASLQTLAATALAEGLTQTEAAARLGVAPETLSRWLSARPELRAEADRLRRELQSRYVDAVWADLDAVRRKVVADALNDDTKPGERHRILKTLVDTATGTETATEVRRKLEAIHAILTDDGDGDGAQS